MTPFTNLKAKGLPLGLENVDTDQILPARFLALKPEDGYADYCFRDLRFDADGSPLSVTPLNSKDYAGAMILIAGSNFGCGSSREGAVYALQHLGFRAVIAESFGDIFYQNALVNGLLPVQTGGETVGQILAHLRASPDTCIHVDLEAQTVHVDGGVRFGFQIDPFKKHCLLNGVDEIGFTFGLLEKIRRFELTRAVGGGGRVG
ncbi:MAG: 3-isopropylmalate dehydratase small subunit [Nitratireductor sp.]